MEGKMLGKIENVTVGYGGYQDAMFGIYFTFSGKGWGVQDGRNGFWAEEWDSRNKWTDEERIKFFGELCMKIAKWLKEAGVDSVDRLKGKPVEVEFESNTLKSWRILTEVI